MASLLHIKAFDFKMAKTTIIRAIINLISNSIIKVPRANNLTIITNAVTIGHSTIVTTIIVNMAIATTIKEASSVIIIIIMEVNSSIIIIAVVEMEEEVTNTIIATMEPNTTVTITIIEEASIVATTITMEVSTTTTVTITIKVINSSNCYASTGHYWVINSSSTSSVNYYYYCYDYSIGIRAIPLT